MFMTTALLEQILSWTGLLLALAFVVALVIGI